METSMEEMESRSPSKWDGSAEPPLPRAGVLVAAVALAAAHALWALFQWTQLVLARSGGDYFCGLGESADCAAVWDTPLASAIHRVTALPVAGFAVLLAIGAGWLGSAVERVQQLERWARWGTAVVFIGLGVYETLRSTLYLISNR